MELIDYARFRWKALVVLFLLGLAAIAAVASGRVVTSAQYTAQTQLLIRPPSSQLNAFNYDLDRYVNTEVATIESQAGLTSEAKGTSFSADELKQVLSTSHDSGTDIAALSVRTGSRASAVSLVNHVAKAYLRDAQARGLESSDRSIAYLQGQIEAQQASLTQASSELARAYRARPGGAGAATDPSLLSPEAYAQQQIAIAALPQLQQQLVELRAAARSAISSRVLNAADTASSSATPWRVSTVLAAVAGLVLALVALVAVAVSLSSRIVSAARWDAVTADSRLRPAIRARAGRRRRRAELRRVVAGIANTGVTGPVTVVPFPANTRRIRRTVTALIGELETSQIPAVEHRPWGTPSPPRNGAGSESGPAVVVVDLTTCRVEDAAVLADSDPSTLHRIVPVLV